MIPIRRKNLDQLAERHYWSIIEYSARKNVEVFTTAHIDGIESLLKANFNNITFKELIISKPEVIDKVAEIFKSIQNTINVEYFQVIPKLFGNFSPKNSNMKLSDGNPYNGNILVESLGLTVCPYCNRNFINNTYDEDNKIERRTSQLDHFYPKSHFPLLAMSFYNLIPCCSTCNFIKKDHPEVNKFYNPYDTRYDGNKAFQFKLKITSPNFYYKKESIEVQYNGLENNEGLMDEQQRRINANLEVFKIKALYENHKDYVIDMIQKNVIYNDSYIDELYQKYEGTLFKNREDVIRLISSNFVTDEDLEKRPLSKLTKDIAEELGLL